MSEIIIESNRRDQHYLVGPIRVADPVSFPAADDSADDIMRALELIEPGSTFFKDVD